MEEQLKDKVAEAIESYRKQLEQDYLEDTAIEKIKSQIENKARIMIQEDLNIPMFENYDKKNIEIVKNIINEQVAAIVKNNNAEPDSVEIPSDDMTIEQIISALEEESEKNKENDEKGNHRNATAKSGRLIRKIKKEIDKIKNDENVNAKDLEALEKLEILLDDQMEWHKDQLTSRYKNEFRKKPATFAAIITVLPKGIKLQADRVVHCIRQLKEAKTNKERIFKVLELGKQLGLLAATPVIFTVKFIVKHWYLLLLLLLLLRLPNFGWLKQKQEKPDHEMEEQYQEQEAYEFENSPATNPVPDDVKDSVTKPVPEPVTKPVTKPVVNAEAANDLSAETARQEQMQIQQQAREAANATEQATQVAETSQAVETAQVVETAQETLTAEQQATANKVAESFISNLERDYRFFVASRHSDVMVVHSAQDYANAINNINPSLHLTAETAEAFCLRQPTVGPVTQAVVWPEADTSIRFFENEAELANYVISGEDQALNDYYYNFINMGESQGLFGSLGNTSLFNQFCQTLGVSGTGGIVLFCLYEIAQYGLAGPTGGLSLLAPG